MMECHILVRSPDNVPKDLKHVMTPHTDKQTSDNYSSTGLPIMKIVVVMTTRTHASTHRHFYPITIYSAII